MHTHAHVGTSEFASIRSAVTSRWTTTNDFYVYVSDAASLTTIQCSNVILSVSFLRALSTLRRHRLERENLKWALVFVTI